MGVFDFVKNAGAKIGIGKSTDEEAAEAAAAAAAQERAERAAERAKARRERIKASQEAVADRKAAAAQEAREKNAARRKIQAAAKERMAEYRKSNELEQYITGLGIDAGGVDIRFDNGTAYITGEVPDQATRERIILAVGGAQGVGRVDEEIAVVEPAEEAHFHTVASGDTLWAVAEKVYGDGSRYTEIFEANKPMLTNPDMIYPVSASSRRLRAAALCVLRCPIRSLGPADPIRSLGPGDDRGARLRANRVQTGWSCCRLLRRRDERRGHGLDKSRSGGTLDQRNRCARKTTAGHASTQAARCCLRQRHNVIERRTRYVVVVAQAGVAGVHERAELHRVVRSHCLGRIEGAPVLGDDMAGATEKTRVVELVEIVQGGIAQRGNADGSSSRLAVRLSGGVLRFDELSSGASIHDDDVDSLGQGHGSR